MWKFLTVSNTNSRNEKNNSRYDKSLAEVFQKTQVLCLVCQAEKRFGNLSGATVRKLWISLALEVFSWCIYCKHKLLEFINADVNIMLLIIIEFNDNALHSCNEYSFIKLVQCVKELNSEKFISLSVIIVYFIN